MEEKQQAGRQAVVVIHGIGEQFPMTTLRAFARGVLGDSEKTGTSTPSFYSKPDRFSSSFELRCLATPGNVRPGTDFYEFYWQHLMPASNWNAIFGWAWFLMRRHPETVPHRLRLYWLLLWLLFVFTIWATAESLLPLLGLAGAPHPDGFSLKLPLGAALLWGFVQLSVLSVIGDAAIYLLPAPPNVEARHRIRAAGLELLNHLHESGCYDRIIVVGHSLGSIIGFDLLNFAWQQFSERHGDANRPSRTAAQEAERVAAKIDDLLKSRERIPEELRDSWRQKVWEVRDELRANGHPWLVSDLITLGSPLAHADLLLAKGMEDLLRHMDQREIPRNPPVLDPSKTFSIPVYYQLTDGSQRTTFNPHHAAWTACVTWTNLFFPHRWLFYGDLVGGPLSPLFGPGVHDVPVSTKRRNGWLSHTFYWTPDDHRHQTDSNALREIRKVLSIHLQ
jgi:hypothetical protein